MTLYEFFVQDIVDSVHSSHVDAHVNAHGDNHGDAHSDSNDDVSDRDDRHQSKGLFMAEKRRLKEEDKAAVHLRRVTRPSRPMMRPLAY